jgi:hypothetical protein
MHAPGSLERPDSRVACIRALFAFMAAVNGYLA